MSDLKYLKDGCPRAKLHAYNWLSGISDANGGNIVEIIFKNTRTGYYLNTESLPLKIGDLVIVESQPGYDIGKVMMTGRLVKLQMKKNDFKGTQDLKSILRFPTNAELDKAAEAHSREHDTMIRARKIAEDLSLNMKIGDVEYQADAAKAIFYYIADERVDFRTLIRVLAETFKIRVEMRQIGARQEAGRIGGIGPCGRPLCCSQWMTKFISVGTGAARVQDLSMNPQKLAGQCGKLKCCLNFETAVYSEAQKQLPPKDVCLETKDATYFYFKPDILSRKITYSTDKRIPANLMTIDASRAFEIIALNKQGIKVDSLLPDHEQEMTKGQNVIDLVEQEELTRFDKSKQKGRKGNQGQKRNQDRKNNSSQKEKDRKNQPDNAPKSEESPNQENREESRNRNRNQGQHRNQNRNNRRNGNSYNNSGNRHTPHHNKETNGQA